MRSFCILLKDDDVSSFRVVLAFTFACAFFLMERLTRAEMGASPELLGLCVGSEQGAALQIQIVCISFFTSFSKSVSAITQAPEELLQMLLAEHHIHKPMQGQLAGVQVVASR